MAETVSAAVRNAWATTLRVEKVADDQDFFDLGGDSMSAMRLIDRLSADIGVEIPIDLLLTDGTLAGLIEYCVVAAGEAENSHSSKR